MWSLAHFESLSAIMNEAIRVRPEALKAVFEQRCLLGCDAT
jgi:hypothetical protein